MGKGMFFCSNGDNITEIKEDLCYTDDKNKTQYPETKRIGTNKEVFS